MTPECRRETQKPPEEVPELPLQRRPLLVEAIAPSTVWRTHGAALTAEPVAKSPGKEVGSLP